MSLFGTELISVPEDEESFTAFGRSPELAWPSQVLLQLHGGAGFSLSALLPKSG